VKGAPTFRCLISAEMFEAAPEQIVLGEPLARSCRKVVGVIVPDGARKSFGAGPVFIPHQLSSAANVPPLWYRVSPLVGTLTHFPTSRETHTLAPVPQAITAPLFVHA